MTHFRSAGFVVVSVLLALGAAACGEAGGVDSPTSIPVELAANSLGPAEIGQTPEAVLGELNSFLGEPDVDSGWIPADSPLYGSCPGTAMRAAGWGSLYAFFVTDEEVTAANPEPIGRLFSYSYGYDFSRNEGATDPRNLALRTAGGIGLGSTRTELAAEYGGALVVEYSEPADTWVWSAPTPAGELRGLLSGPEDDATVVLIESSPSCEIS